METVQKDISVPKDLLQVWRLLVLLEHIVLGQALNLPHALLELTTMYQEQKVTKTVKNAHLVITVPIRANPK